MGFKLEKTSSRVCCVDHTVDRCLEDAKVSQLCTLGAGSFPVGIHSQQDRTGSIFTTTLSSWGRGGFAGLVFAEQSLLKSSYRKQGILESGGSVVGEPRFRQRILKNAEE